MESWCRICSRSDEFRRFPLFSVADVSQEVIAKMITSCTDTQVSSEDGLPQQICPDCLITLSLAYSFRRLCRRTDAKFRETFDPRAPSRSAEHMAPGGNQPQRSQSQAGDESGGVTYDSVPVIKEEVEFYEYECSAPPPPPPPEDQMSWVIQNPRTIHEGSVAAVGGGAMTVLHNVGQYQEDGGGGGEGQLEVDDMMSSMVPMVTMEEGGAVGGHDPAEYGESSGSGQRKKKHEPERFSKRIRRQGTSRREVRKYTNKALTAALEAIYRHKITFREAEETYAVPRATLNRAFKRYIAMHGGSVKEFYGERKANPAEWSEEDMRAALNAICNEGLNYDAATVMFNVPRAIMIRRHQRLEKRIERNGGVFPGFRAVWSAEDMDRALRDVLEGRHTVASAAKVYNIPRSTLRNRYAEHRQSVLRAEVPEFHFLEAFTNKTQP